MNIIYVDLNKLFGNWTQTDELKAHYSTVKLITSFGWLERVSGAQSIE
jgi:hypothetical protein